MRLVAFYFPYVAAFMLRVPPLHVKTGCNVDAAYWNKFLSYCVLRCGIRIASFLKYAASEGSFLVTPPDLKTS
jgi:hypothetical protein